jgi:hypothetical protein
MTLSWVKGHNHTYQVTMQFQVEVTLVGMQPYIALLLHKLVTQHILVNSSCKQRPRFCTCP